MTEEGSPATESSPAPRRRWWSALQAGAAAVAVIVVVAAVAFLVVDDSDPDVTVRPLANGSGGSPGADAQTSTTAPESTTTTKPRPPGPVSMTLAFAGDLLPHLPLDAQAAAYGDASGNRYDFAPMLAPMRPVLEAADVAICHMEVPVAADQDNISGYPAFGAPEELVDGARSAGYDGCSTASNHSLDQGRAGIAATLERFDNAGLRHAGTARTAEEGDTITTYEVDGAQVAHLSYAYGFNGYTIPRDAPFAVNEIDPERVRADARRAREGGADLVVVSLHWGTEYQHDPSDYQRQMAAAILPSEDIDVIIGHHAHVVQPIEQVEGTYVVFGLGNQLANQGDVPKADGLTVVLHADQQPDGRYRVVGIEAVPTFVEAGGSYKVWPIVATLADPATPAGLRSQLQASFDRTNAVLAGPGTKGVMVAQPA